MGSLCKGKDKSIKRIKGYKSRLKKQNKVLLVIFYKNQFNLKLTVDLNKIKSVKISQIDCFKILILLILVKRVQRTNISQFSLK